MSGIFQCNTQSARLLILLILLLLLLLGSESRASHMLLNYTPGPQRSLLGNHSATLGHQQQHR